MSLRLVLAPSIGNARAQARADLLQRSLSHELGEPVEIVMAADYAELSRQALGGNAHLIWAPPGVCAGLEPEARAIFKCVRRGSASYRSAIIVRREDASLGTAGLAGKRAAWVDQLSLGGYLLALHHLEHLGLDSATAFVEQRFVGSYPEALREVVFAQADVTAVSVTEPTRESAADSLGLFAGPAQAERLEAIAYTSSTPNDALVLTKAIDQGRADALARRLFEQGGPGHEPATLCMALEADGFERAQPGEYERLRVLFRQS